MTIRNAAGYFYTWMGVHLDEMSEYEFIRLYLVWQHTSVVKDPSFRKSVTDEMERCFRERGITEEMLVNHKARVALGI